MAARTAADGVGARDWVGKWGGEKKPLGMSELGCADGCGRRACKECLKMGGEKKVLGMSELGCADGCGRRVCKGVAGEKKTLGMSELADGCGRRGCNGVAGNGWGGQAWKMVALSAGYVRI